MKASRFSDAQKAFILKQSSDGMPVADVCRKAGISQATYFNWKKKYAGMMPSEMRRVRELEQENARLKRIVAISRSTARCCRTSSSESSEACPEESAGRRAAIGVGDLDTPCLCGDPIPPEDLPIQVASIRSGRSGTADQGDLPDPHALRLSARTCAAAARGMVDQSEENLQDL